MTRPVDPRGRWCNERGFVAGAEAVALGVLVLLAGTILMVNAWAVVDTRMALESAAREYLRAYTEADSPDAAAAAGELSWRAVLADRPALAARVSVTPPPPARFGPCAPAPVTLSATVPSIHIPFVGGFGDHTVDVSAVELVDAHREMAPGDAYVRGATACGGG